MVINGQFILMVDSTALMIKHTNDQHLTMPYWLMMISCTNDLSYRLILVDDDYQWFMINYGN